jgi:teichuronic acid biosynthesis glycosyltransferase TuaC
MRVLFVSSGNAKDGISPIVRNQGQSLIGQGVLVDFFTINGKGIWSYFRHIFILRKFLKTNKFDIIHSHYSFSSYVAAISSASPLVVSLMGSDVLSDRLSRLFISFFHKYLWNQTIVKSMEMHQRLGLSKIKIIPNGVNIDRINSLDKEKCKNKLGWGNGVKHILFAGDPTRAEKNYSLARNSIRLLKNGNEIIVHFLKDIPNEDIQIYLNAADVLILCSLHEGSPNVIKEAMACNCPIVTTNVGDVKWVIGNTEGCFITSFKPEDVAEKIKIAIEFREKHEFTNGRERIIKLGLDSETIASKIIEVYSKLLIGES